MLDTKLILVEGCLPGSGKSTTSQMIALQLHKRGIAARWYSESEDPHQVHVLKAMTGQAIDRDDFEQESLRFWQSFAGSTRHVQEVAILDSVLLQHPMVSLLLRCQDMWLAEGIDEEWFATYLAKVQTVLQVLSPVLVFLCPDDAGAILRKLCAERGAVWSQWAIDLLTDSPYSARKGYTGFEGAAAVFELFRTTNINLFSRLTMPKIEINVSAGDWIAYHQQVMDFIGLPLIRDGASSSQSWERFAGVYRDPDSEFKCTIRLQAGQLAVNNLWEYREGSEPVFIPLVPRTAHTFFVRGTPVELSFERLPTEQAWRVSIGGSYGEHSGKVLFKQE